MAWLFRLFRDHYVSVRRLRLTVTMTPLEYAKHPMMEERLALYMEPFYRIAKSREWLELVLVVCEDWYGILETRAAGQSVWRLMVTHFDCKPRVFTML
jgi:hypothetical protein